MWNFFASCGRLISSRNGMLEIHLLPKKGVGKEISALKVRFLQNSWLTTSCLLGRCSRGWLWVLNLWFPHHSRFLQHLAELGKDGKGSLTCPAGVWIWVSLLKQLDLLKEPKFLLFFFFFGSSQQSIFYLFIIFYLLSSLCWWCFPSGNHRCSELLQFPEALEAPDLQIHQTVQRAGK